MPDYLLEVEVRHGRGFNHDQVKKARLHELVKNDVTIVEWLDMETIQAIDFRIDRWYRRFGYSKRRDGDIEEIYFYKVYQLIVCRIKRLRERQPSDPELDEEKELQREYEMASAWAGKSFESGGPETSEEQGSEIADTHSGQGSDLQQHNESQANECDDPISEMKENSDNSHGNTNFSLQERCRTLKQASQVSSPVKRERRVALRSVQDCPRRAGYEASLLLTSVINPVPFSSFGAHPRNWRKKFILVGLLDGNFIPFVIHVQAPLMVKDEITLRYVTHEDFLDNIERRQRGEL